MIPVIGRRRRMALAEKANRPEDVVTKSVNVLARDTGVVLQLHGPLSRFSGLYPWYAVPGGIAVLRLLSEAVLAHPDEDPGDAFRIIVRELGTFGITWETVEEILGRDSRNARAILRQAPNLLQSCPSSYYRSEMGKILEMDHEQLGEYVGNILLC